MSELWNDVKHALHLFIKSPGFTIAAVSALALGIGANTAIFTVVNAVLLKPLTYPDADRIVEICDISGRMAATPSRPFRSSRSSSSRPASSKKWRHTILPGRGSTSRGPGRSRSTAFMSAEGYFGLFGAPVMLGRTFTQAGRLAQRRQRSGAELRLVAAAIWRRIRKVIGQVAFAGRTSRTRLSAFWGGILSSDPEADIWVPFQFEPNSTNQGHFFRPQRCCGRASRWRRRTHR